MWFRANSGSDPLPRSSRMHFNTTLRRCYTHVSDRLLRSILKRKCNHLSIEQALERDGEGEKAHTHSYVNMLQQEERGLQMLEADMQAGERGERILSGRLGMCEET